MIDNSPTRRQVNIGVIVVNYHSAHLLERCLNCLTNQSFTPAHVVVVNNDESAGAVDFLSEQYFDYQFIAPGNIGFAAANNLAISLLRDCDWIALINPDAFPEPDWLFRLASVIDSHPAAGMYSSQLLCAGADSIIDGEGDCYHISGLAWRLNHGRHVDSNLHRSSVFSPCAAAAIYSRSALSSIGGFDENYFCYFEDVDLGFRLRLRGYEVIHVPEAVVYHVGGGSSKSLGLSDFAIYHGHRNLVWTFVKNMPGYLFWLFLPAHLLMNIVTILFFMGKGKGRIIIRAKWDAIKELPRVWQQRREIQQTRTVKPAAILKHLSFGLIR